MDTNTYDYDSVHPPRNAPSKSSYFLQDCRPVQQDGYTSTYALGIPATRKLFSYVHLAAVIVSLLCFVLGALTITPSLTIAWHLRFNGQIIVIGLLLGIMNLCMQTILPFTFLLLEERFGRCRLQNYQAIISGQLAGSHVNLLWRLTLFFLLALPLGLSVAYKRFLGGTTSAPYHTTYAGSYGIDFPRVGSWSPTNDALYLLQTSFAAFQTASGLGNATYPSADAFPLVYGYNTLLINDESAAILDLPKGSYLTHLQSGMSASETLHINASVDAYMASYNTSTTGIMSDDSLWADIIESGTREGQWGLSTMYLYKGKGARIGVMPFDSNTQTLVALYYNSTEWGGMDFHLSNDAEFDVFRRRAQIYNINRSRCKGSWSLNTTSILLIGGSCDTSTPVDSSILQWANMGPFPYDTLPSMAHTYGYYASSDTDSVWLRATYAVSLVTMYWARSHFMLSGDLNTPHAYAPMDEVIVSVRSSLRTGSLLYFVLAVQPVLTVLGFLVAMWLHRTPIGKDFGLVSILSGVEPATLGLVRGAGLSGRSMKPVKLDINANPTGLNGEGARIQYLLKEENEEREISYLKKGSTYS
jgi:hypothetical protein